MHPEVASQLVPGRVRTEMPEVRFRQKVLSNGIRLRIASHDHRLEIEA